MLFFCRTTETPQRLAALLFNTRFRGNGSEDKCSFIITNTFIVTLFEASRTRNEFYIERTTKGINSLVVEDLNTDTEGVVDQPDCVIIKYSFL